MELTEHVAAAMGRLAELRVAAARGDVAPDIDEALGALTLALEELEVSAAAERAYRGLFEQAPDAYIVTDPDGAVVEANEAAAALLRVSLDRLRQAALVDFVEPSSRAAFRQHVVSLVAGIELPRWDVKLQPQRGSALVASTDVAVARAGDGEVLELRWALRDVTANRGEQQALLREFAETTEEYEELREIDLWKDAFLAAAAHDLRAPLIALETGAESIFRNPALPREAVTEIAERMFESARRLGRLLADLLDLDHFTRGKVTARRVPTELIALVEEVCGQIDLDGHPVEVLGAPVTVALDDVRVEQIVQNLLTNAVNHTPSGTAVRVEVLGDERGVTILVEDEGPGVPDEVRADMFMPFVGAASHDRDPGGAGIGLSLVRLFAELHGGKVSCDDRPGGGSRFIVELPGPGPDTGPPSA